MSPDDERLVRGLCVFLAGMYIAFAIVFLMMRRAGFMP